MAGPVTEASLSWVRGTMFEAEGEGGARLQIDSPVAKGGGGLGFSPMQLLLHALAACMAVTVVQIVVEHRFRGAGLTRPNLERLVEMVEERYCSVAAALPRGLIEHVVVLPDEAETAGRISARKPHPPALSPF